MSVRSHRPWQNDASSEESMPDRTSHGFVMVNAGNYLIDDQWIPVD